MGTTVIEAATYEQMSCFLPRVREMTEEEKKEYREMTKDSEQLNLDDFLSI